MKVTNLGVSPVSVFCGGISMAVAPNDFIDSEKFTAGEIEFVKKYPQQFGVEGDVPTGEFDQDDYDAAKRDRETLQSIIDLFGTPEVDRLNVKSAVERLIQDLAAKGDVTVEVNGGSGDLIASQSNETTIATTIDTSPGASDLASAVALLDDANDDHWTQAGKPKIQALKSLVDGEITAADYDALPEDQKRERKQ